MKVCENTKYIFVILQVEGYLHINTVTDFPTFSCNTVTPKCRLILNILKLHFMQEWIHTQKSSMETYVKYVLLDI